MARRYSVCTKDTGTASTTLVGVTSAATVRPRITDVILGSDAAPADHSAELQLKRYTAAGTSTAWTPVSLDSADPASLASAGYNHSVEPTYTANAILLEIAMNQRATVRIQLAPGREIILPATAANGAGLFVNATDSAFSIASTIIFEE